MPRDDILIDLSVVVGSVGASPVHRAIYSLRYSAFVPSGGVAVTEASEIAGDNAMYQRSVFDEHRSLLAYGFWEVEAARAHRN